MTSGGQCVVTTGVDLMLLLSVNSWDIPTPEVSLLIAIDTGLKLIIWSQ